jgi:hypothetical protein
MGASGWKYMVPYQEDLDAALAILRREVFEQGDFVKPSYYQAYGGGFGVPDPASLEDLDQERYSDFMGESGTHSIIDIHAVAPADSDPDQFATIRPLSEAEYVELFGVARPSLVEYESLADSERLQEYVNGGRWTGRAAVLWTGDSPTEIVFWGYSGD